MPTLEAELGRARALDPDDLADAIESIGFECTRCGACCKGYDTEEGHEPHTATVFPDEIRRLVDAAGDSLGSRNSDAGDTVPDASDGSRDDASDGSRDDDAGGSYDWRDVARPVPYGLVEGESGPEGETFEWALATDACGDCTFYREDDGVGACAVHDDRPLVCETYPFSVALGGTSQPMGEAVDGEGMVRAHECEGLGREISRADAETLATALKRRAIRELEEAIAVRDSYEPTDPGPGEVVVHDSEGAKRPDGAPYEG